MFVVYTERCHEDFVFGLAMPVVSDYSKEKQDRKAKPGSPSDRVHLTLLCIRLLSFYLFF